MNLEDALSLEKGDRIILLLTPENSGVEWGRCVEATIQSSIDTEYGDVYCEMEVQSLGDILHPYPHREKWVGYMELRYILGRAGCYEDKHDQGFERGSR